MGDAYEEEHVHSVYEEIAGHFSSTRYKVRTEAPDSSPIQIDRRQDMHVSNDGIEALAPNVFPRQRRATPRRLLTCGTTKGMHANND
jgi:hypothetical protein